MLIMYLCAQKAYTQIHISTIVAVDSTWEHIRWQWRMNAFPIDLKLLLICRYSSWTWRRAKDKINSTQRTWRNECKHFLWTLSSLLINSSKLWWEATVGNLGQWISTCIYKASATSYFVLVSMWDFTSQSKYQIFKKLCKSWLTWLNYEMNIAFSFDYAEWSGALAVLLSQTIAHSDPSS